MSDLVTANAALVTPFAPNGDVDWSRLTDHARQLLDRGLTSLTLFGTTGEGASISEDEHASAVERFGEAGIAANLLVDAVLRSSARDAGSQARRALRQGCRAILVAPPFYYEPVSGDAVFAWFAEVVERIGGEARDIIPYNIPSVTGVHVGPDILGRLRSTFGSVIAGVKDSSGEVATTRLFLQSHRDLCILVGHEGYLADAVREGASGTISGVANFEPELVARLVAGRQDERASPLVDMILACPVVPAVKELVARRKGADWRRVRPPLQQLSSRQADGIVSNYETLFGLGEETRAGR